MAFKPRTPIPTYDPLEDNFALADSIYSTPTPELPENLEFVGKTYWQHKSEQTIFIKNPPKSVKAKTDILVVSPCLLEEDAATTVEGTYHDTKRIPGPMSGPLGNVLKETMRDAGIDLSKVTFVSMVPWVLPKYLRSRMYPAKLLVWCTRRMLQLVEAYSPKVIVALGRDVMNACMSYKIAHKDLVGGLIQYAPNLNDLTKEQEKFAQKTSLFVADNYLGLAKEPGLVVNFETWFRELNRHLHNVSIFKGFAHISQPKPEECNYTTVDTIEELKDIVTVWEELNIKILSVDCEWHGENPWLGGVLRSIQFCWQPGHAVYVRFTDAEGNFTFAGTAGNPKEDMLEVGEVINNFMHKQDAKFIGHQITADFQWMRVKLGIDTYQKAVFDTLTARQITHEHADLKLEHLAVAFTNLGRYDIDLRLYLKRHVKKKDGYKGVPDELLIPYSLKDVDTVMRSYPILMMDILSQDPTNKLFNYYTDLFLPFTTDIFTELSVTGLPVDLNRLERLRGLFSKAWEVLRDNFQEAIKLEAFNKHIFEFFFKLWSLNNYNNASLEDLMEVAQKATDFFKETVMEEWENSALTEESIKHNLYQTLQTFEPQGLKLTGDDALYIGDVSKHIIFCMAGFNPQSPQQLRPWLFNVAKLTPVKSTNQKDKGLPSTSWEKVLELPPAEQKKYTPAADADTLSVLVNELPTIQLLMELNGVGSIKKSFLKADEVDEDGNVLEKKGLLYWVGCDGRIHSQYSPTETGRPRSWKPNTLNLPSWTKPSVDLGMTRALQLDQSLVEEYKDLVMHEDKLKIPSIRSVVQAPKGYCFVESDYQTAEVRGLAFISGDEKLIAAVTEPDPQFAILKTCTKPEDPGDEDKIRLSYAEDCGIPKENQDMSLLWHKVSKGVAVEAVAKEDLLRNPDGSLKHPRHDMHWELAERVNKKPRELLNKKLHRGAAKVGRFQSSYGSGGAGIELSIKTSMGVDVPAGYGDELLDAIASSQPIADAFLKDVASKPLRGEKLQAASGRIRHFYSYGNEFGFTNWQLKKMANPMSREAMNFYMQESVGATAARAAIWLTDHFYTHNMKARIVTILYDSVVTLCPLEERFTVANLHQTYMCDKNTWEYHDRIMNYPIDTDFVYRWSESPTEKESQQLNNKTFYSN